MIKSIKPWQLLHLLLLLLASCKEELNMPEPESMLEVRVVNSQNQPVPDAEVRVYTSASDWKNEKNAYTKGITGSAGNIQLTGIGADSLWIKATWIDLATKEVFQNTLVNFEPVPPLPANSQAVYRVKINSAKVLKGILIRQAEYSGYPNSPCDRDGYNYQRDIYYCSYRYKLQDVSGEACDLYLLIENGTSQYDNSLTNYFYRSAVQVDVTGENLIFEVNDTITDFRKQYYIGVREHMIVNPASYSAISCFNGNSTYANLGDYLASKDGQEQIIRNVDWWYLYARAPLLNVKNSTLPHYPAEEFTIKLSAYSNATLKLSLEWIYE